MPQLREGQQQAGHLRNTGHSQMQQQHQQRQEESLQIPSLVSVVVIVLYADVDDVACDMSHVYKEKELAIDVENISWASAELHVRAVTRTRVYKYTCMTYMLKC